MILRMDRRLPACRELDVLQPQPTLLYDVDAAARLAGVTRRSLLLYCRAGLVQPVVLPPYGMLEFTGDAVLDVRRYEALRAAHGREWAWLKTMVDLLDDVARLRAELRLLQAHSTAPPAAAPAPARGRDTP